MYGEMFAESRCVLAGDLPTIISGTGRHRFTLVKGRSQFSDHVARLFGKEVAAMHLLRSLGIVILSLLGATIHAEDLPKFEIHVRHSEVADGKNTSYADILDRSDNQIWFCQFSFMTSNPKQHESRCTSKPLPHLRHFQIDDARDHSTDTSAPWNAFRWLVDQEAGDVVVCWGNFYECQHLERPKPG
jgi:hypothetical protein